MKLTVNRHIFSQHSTMGMADIDGVFQCYTLEPPQRDTKPCCIPAGTYKAHKYLSPTKFIRLPNGDKQHYIVILLENVPGFEAIEWHIGNFPEDTIGCTLVGKAKGLDCVGNSKTAFAELMAKLPNEFDVTYIDAQID